MNSHSTHEKVLVSTNFWVEQFIDHHLQIIHKPIYTILSKLMIVFYLNKIIQWTQNLTMGAKLTKKLSLYFFNINFCQILKFSKYANFNVTELFGVITWQTYTFQQAFCFIRTMQWLRYHILPCMRQGMLTLSGSSSGTSHSDIYILSIFHYLEVFLIACWYLTSWGTYILVMHTYIFILSRIWQYLQ